jgi:very-short-patch-repair endonuclease
MSATHFYGNLFNGARPSTYERARELRKRQTEAEKKLWRLLRNRQLQGKKFRRQHPYAHFILDFYCAECQLAIEVDGSVHLDEVVKAKDKARIEFLIENKITVLRFWNSEVLNEPEKVLQQITRYL